MKPAQTLRPNVLTLLAPWQWARNESSRRAWWLRVLFWLLMALVPAAAALRWLPQLVAALMLSLVLSSALLALWSVQFSALLRLDHPHPARLVPGYARALRAGALALWAAASVVGAGLVVLLLAWAPVPMGWADLLSLALAGAGAALLIVALALRWPLLWLLLLLFPVSGRWPMALAHSLWPHWQAQPWLACGVLMVVMALALVSLFGQGDAAHARAWEGREQLRRITQAGLAGQKPALAAYGRWGEWLGSPWQRLADGWLARATRHARPTVASVMTRAEIVLHGAQHWVRHFGVLVPLLIALMTLFTALALYAAPGGSARLFESGHVGMGIGLTSMVLGTVVSLPGALWGSRREQALLMLLPGIPRGAALNRALAWRQARHFLMLWALTLPAFLGMAWAGGVPQVLALPALLLPALAWLWRDVAHQREPSAAAGLLPFLSFLLPAAGSIVLLRERPDALLPLLGVTAAGGVAVLAWRWWRLSHWPQALPAGRLG